MKTLVLTCPQLDDGRRMQRFQSSMFPQVEFVFGESAQNVVDNHKVLSNSFDYGYGPSEWDKPALAVAYGHFRLWQKVQALGETCLLLEDDALPVPQSTFDYFNLESWINSLQLPEHWLITLWLKGIYQSTYHCPDLDKVKPSYENSGLIGYLLPPNTATILIESFPHTASPVDHHVLGATQFLQSKIDVFVPKFNLIDHDDGVSLRKPL